MKFTWQLQMANRRYWMNIPFPFKLVDDQTRQIKSKITKLTDALSGKRPPTKPARKGAFSALHIQVSLMMP
ncbi:MAG: hypothetical protein R3C61_12085 [Bacteroidia bacterium]